MFAIYDTSARVAGFGGRVIGAGEPKYLNSPETITFSKGKMLYGLNWARNAIRRPTVSCWSRDTSTWFGWSSRAWKR
jgi:DNA primase